MDRRPFLASLSALTGALVVPSGVRAQVAGVARPEWSGEGVPTGREPVDVARLDALEREHVPVLTMPERVRPSRPFDLVVQVGVVPHEQLEAHHVTWVEVSLGESRVFVADLAAGVAFPIVRVPLMISAPTTLSVRSRCTQHGVWLTRRVITPAE